MNFRRLKELTRKLGGILVLDGDEPEFVILPYKQYEKIESGEEVLFPSVHNGLAEANGMSRRAINEEEDQKMVEKLNQEILSLKEEIRQREEAELIENEQSTEAVAEVVDPVRDGYLD